MKIYRAGRGAEKGATSSSHNQRKGIGSQENSEQVINKGKE